MESVSMLNSSSIDEFERENFNVESYVKRVAAESIYASTIAEHKDKLNRLSQQTAEEIKQNVYKNYDNFMETSREVGHLEGKMNQMRQSLDEQKKLLQLFKSLNLNNAVQMLSSSSNNNQAKSTSAPGSSLNSSLSLLLEQVEGCSLIAQKAGRNLLYHSDLEALHTDDFSVSHKLHAYLLTDSLLLTLPQRKRTRSNFNATGATNSLLSAKNKDANNYLYKFHAFYELHDIKVINIEDSKEVRNSFQLYKFPECLSFRCVNAHIKKEWLENIDNAKKRLSANSDDRSRPYTDLTSSVIEEEDEENENTDDSLDESLEHKKKNKTLDLSNLSQINENERQKILRDLFSEFDILLAQRDFEKAVEMLLKIKRSNALQKQQQQQEQQNSSLSQDDFQQLVYKQKETELISILRKDLIQSKERGNSKGVVKTGKRVVNSLIRLKIYDEAMDLFIDFHKYLNSETLRRIKLEESNQIYMNNVLNSFFENLKQSFLSFNEQFEGPILTQCLSTYLSWCDTEIEILIKKLQSQHYLGRHFDLTIENCQLIFLKCKQFTDFETKFLFETKLSQILESTIREQLDILIDASIQRSKLELDQNNLLSNTEQNRSLHIQNLLKDIELKQFGEKFSEKDFDLVKKCTLSAVQFTRGALDFFFHCSKVYYQDINFAIVESFVKLFKAELKIYQIFLNKNNASAETTKIKKQDIFNNVCLIEKVFSIIEEMYTSLTGVHSKHFVKLVDKIKKFKEENFISL